MVRLGAATGAAGIVALVLASGLAWACTEQPTIVGVGPMVGEAGHEVTVKGHTGVSEAPVEIRWNANNGLLVGMANADKSGNFATAMKVPEAAPGVYSIVAVASGAGMARMAYEVTGPVATGSTYQTPASLWSQSPPVAATAGAAGGSTTTALVGAGLLSAGLVTLFAGFGFAAVRRRRATT